MVYVLHWETQISCNGNCWVSDFWETLVDIAADPLRPDEGISIYYETNNKCIDGSGRNIGVKIKNHCDPNVEVQPYFLKVFSLYFLKTVFSTVSGLFLEGLSIRNRRQNKVCMSHKIWFCQEWPQSWLHSVDYVRKKINDQYSSCQFALLRGGVFGGWHNMELQMEGRERRESYSKLELLDIFAWLGQGLFGLSRVTKYRH